MLNLIVATLYEYKRNEIPTYELSALHQPDVKGHFRKYGIESDCATFEL